MSVKLASFSEGFDTKELDEMSVQLASLVVHLDTKTPVGQLPHTEHTEIENLIFTANRAQGDWDLFMTKVFAVMSLNVSAYVRKTASDFLFFSDKTLDSAPMNNSLAWGVYAGNPILTSRLSLMMSAQHTRHVIQMAEVVSKANMTQGVSVEYNTFLDTVSDYIQAYEKRRQRLEHDVTK